MPRSIWTGAISFGLVSIPVTLHSAVSEKSVRFHQVQRGTSQRIRYRRVNEVTGVEVAYEDIDKALDTADGGLVVLTDRELESASPTRTRTIEIDDFVDQSAIDPVYYSQAYYLVPSTPLAARPYSLLVQAMNSTHRSAVATFVMRGREHLALLRPLDGVLALETLYFADEVRDPADSFTAAADAVPASDREVSIATSLIEAMTTAWDPARYHDHYRTQVEEIVERKLRGLEVATASAGTDTSKLVDLMDALQQSVDRAHDRRQESATATEGDRATSGTTGNDAAPAASSSSPPSRGSRRGAAEPRQDLSRLSRDELYQRAQAIGLAGRSNMSREELERALRRARPSRRAS